MTEPNPARTRPGLLARLRDRDHTRGSLWRSLAVLALPLLATSAAGAVFQLVDLGFVSRLGEDATTAVIVTNQSLRQLLFMLLMGASFGAQGLIARSIGQGDQEAADHVAGQVLLLGAAIAIGVAAVGVPLARELLGLMQVSAPVLEVGVSYTRWVLGLSFLLVFGMLVAGILNGAGDTTTPMIITLIQTAVSLVAEWLLIFGRFGLPELGILGVAAGLAVGQAVALFLSARVLFRGQSRVHVRLRHLRPDPAQLRAIVALAWPPALQMIGGYLVTVAFLGLAGRLGPESQAAYSIGLRLAMVGPMLAFPLAGACATLVGQNLGAGDPQRAWRALFTGLAAHLAVLWTVAAVLFWFRVAIVAAFSDDPEVIRLGSSLLAYQAGTFVAYGFYFVFFRTLQGAGDVAVPMLLSLGNSLFVTLPLGFGLTLYGDRGIEGIFLATLVGAFSVTVATGAWLATGRWARRSARGRRPEERNAPSGRRTASPADPAR